MLCFAFWMKIKFFSRCPKFLVSGGTSFNRLRWPQIKWYKWKDLILRIISFQWRLNCVTYSLVRFSPKTTIGMVDFPWQPIKSYSFFSTTLLIKWKTPCERAWKTESQYVPFCLRPLLGVLKDVKSEGIVQIARQKAPSVKLIGFCHLYFMCLKKQYE